MKTNILTIIIFSIFSIISINVTAKTTTNTQIISVTNSTIDTSKLDRIGTGAFGEILGETKGGENAPDYIRKPKALPQGFTGYKVELFTVFNKELALTDDLFKTFGGITIERRTDNSYTYLVGNFEDKEAVEDYLTKVIQSRYPDATGVKYQNGEVVKFK